MKKLSLLLCFLLSACSSMNTGEVVGIAGGAAAGGLVGLQMGKGHGKTAMTLVGAGLGAVGGGMLGKQLSE